MLKRLVIPAVILTFVLCCHAKDVYPATKATQSQTPAKEIASVAAQNSDGSQLQRDPATDPSANEPKSVRIIPPRRDIYDYVVFASGIVLALVGIGGIGVGVCTLRKIERQANHMD